MGAQGLPYSVIAKRLITFTFFLMNEGSRWYKYPWCEKYIFRDLNFFHNLIRRHRSRRVGIVTRINSSLSKYEMTFWYGLQVILIPACPLWRLTQQMPKAAIMQRDCVFLWVSHCLVFNINFSKLVMAYGMITHSGPNKTQCISMDLNKKSGTEPKTTAGSKRTPLGFKITMLIPGSLGPQ